VTTRKIFLAIKPGIFPSGKQYGILNYMLYPFVLALHILIACGTIGVAVWALLALWKGREASYRACALALGLVAAAEVFTGTALALLSPELSAAALAAHIAEYLGACLAIEAIIFIRMQKISLAFPFSSVASPVLASVILFAAAVGGGF
jgi:hypothetical protein